MRMFTTPLLTPEQLLFLSTICNYLKSGYQIVLCDTYDLVIQIKCTEKILHRSILVEITAKVVEYENITRMKAASQYRHGV